MHDDQHPYYLLYHDLRKGGTAELLRAWLVAHPGEPEWLRAFAARVGEPIPAATTQERWRLYALSRVFDLLILGRQEGEAEWPGPEVTPGDVSAFVDALGLVESTPTVFSPFDHEIVRVNVSGDDDRVRVREHCWPRLTLGPMLMQRSGVWVEVGRRALVNACAERNTLYWAHVRRGRPHTDRSVGWGHNSQWRTDFRRDYRLGGSLWFNVDGRCDLADPGSPVQEDLQEMHAEDGLTRAERVELLVHRCLVSVEKPDGHLWPWDDTLRLDDDVGA